MYRLLGITALIIGCSWIGFLKARQLKLESMQIMDAIRGIRILRSELSVRLMSVNDACGCASRQIGGEVGSLFSKCRCFSMGESFAQQWHSAVNAAAINRDLKEELLRLSDFFGRYDMDEQLRSFDLMCERLRDLYELSLETYTRDGRIYRSIGVSAGFMLGILLL